MASYISPPIETDPDQLQQEAFDYIQTRWPNWVPSEGNFEAWLIAACARMVAEARDIASDVPTAIFRFYGYSVLGIPPVDATSATVESTWVVADTAGYTIEAGTYVAIEDADGNAVGFEVSTDVEILAGASTTAAGEVLLIAVEPGADGSGLGSNGLVVELIDPVDWVTSVTLTGQTLGGTDAETDDAYLARLATRAQLLTPKPITPTQFELYSKIFAEDQGLAIRALALDLYDPGDGLYTHEKTVSVAVIDDETGLDMPSGFKTDLQAAIGAERETNFVVHILDANRTTVDVTFVATSLPNAVPAEVEAAAEQAVSDYLSPANWGQPAATEDRQWLKQTVVRRLELATVINNVEGLDAITTLTIGINGGAQDTTETHALSGAAPLAVPGAIAGTVS